LNASFIGGCGAPENMKVTVKAAIKNGRAVGVSVYTTPPAASVASCIDRHVRGLSWPSNPKMDDSDIISTEGTTGAEPAQPFDPAAAEAEIARLRDESLRALAEVENVRKRGERAAQDARVFAIEYGLLGLVTGAVATAIGTAVAWAVVALRMRADWSFAGEAAAVTVVAAVVLTLAIGFAGTFRALGRKAAPYLRND